MPFLHTTSPRLDDRIKGLEDESRAILGLLLISAVTSFWNISRLTDRITTMNGRTSKLELMAVSPEQSPAGQSLGTRLSEMSTTVQLSTANITALTNIVTNHEEWHKEQNLSNRIVALEAYVNINRTMIRFLAACIALIVPTLVGVALNQIL